MVQKLSKPMPYSPCKPPPAPSAFKCRLIESQMCVATYLKSGSPSAVRGTPSPSSLTTRHCSPFSRLRLITTVLACASILFSTNSAIAFRGLLWESAMMRMAFQSSPIRNLPFSDMFRLAVLFFVTNVRSLSVEWKRPRSTDHATITCGLNPTQSCAVMPQQAAFSPTNCVSMMRGAHSRACPDSWPRTQIPTIGAYGPRDSEVDPKDVLSLSHGDYDQDPGRTRLSSGSRRQGPRSCRP